MHKAARGLCKVILAQTHLRASECPTPKEEGHMMPRDIEGHGFLRALEAGRIVNANFEEMLGLKSGVA